MEKRDNNQKITNRTEDSFGFEINNFGCEKYIDYIQGLLYIRNQYHLKPTPTVKENVRII